MFLDIFSSAVMNDLTMTFTSRLQMDAKCAVKLDQSGELFWNAPLQVECMGICVLSLAHGSELRDSDVYLHIMKN